MKRTTFWNPTAPAFFLRASKMDTLDKRILKLIQNDFPLKSRPFLHLATELGIAEDLLIERLKRLQKEGIIKYIKPILNAHTLGYTSILAGAKVDPAFIEPIAAKINAISGVTHNYERNHEFNLWFTITSPDKTEIEKHIDTLRKLEGVEAIMILPAEKIYKTRVSFAI
ncbi:MAG TPA: hypothetical protein DCS13_12420 [Candidatus Margulisbacteria bacterium]|nr:hypothetical protein [Candidatus Margulisiibacteriota bacterium]HCY36582.1 hypothetical protein [Candidatus Margulisiibacteriota bacterium]